MTYTETVRCADCGHKKNVKLDTNDCCMLDDILEAMGWYQRDDGMWVCRYCAKPYLESA